VSQFQSSYFGLLALIILASSVLSLRLQSDLLTYTISAIASIIVINSTLILASGLEYRGLLTVYSGYIFCISLIGALGLLEAAGHLLDLGYIVILLLLLTIYHYNTGLRELLTAELPIILIASVILGVYVGLHNPLRYSVTALIDAVSLIVVSSTGEDIVLFLAASLLVFTVLYAMPTADAEHCGFHSNAHNIHSESSTGAPQENEGFQSSIDPRYPIEARAGGLPLNTRLLILGLNILVVSLLLVVYGVLVGDNGLVGVAVSLGIVGGVLVVYSTTPQDPSIIALTSYSEILVNATTSALEDLDLLEPSICAIRRADLTLLVYSKTPCPVEVDPGLGFTSGSPYLAIPVKTPIELTESSSEPAVTQLERNLGNPTRRRVLSL
jgi:hypothetical protein